MLLLGACVTKQKVLDASAVSMTHYSLKEGQKLEEKGMVSGRFCTSNDHKGTMGLMDESIKDAQQTSGVDFILNASFYQEGSCMLVEGTGAKIK